LVLRRRCVVVASALSLRLRHCVIFVVAAVLHCRCVVGVLRRRRCGIVGVAVTSFMLRPRRRCVGITSSSPLRQRCRWVVSIASSSSLHRCCFVVAVA
jgi:hypothetical protein